MPDINRNIRVGIVDDSKVVVASLTRYLNYADGITVALTASSGKDLLSQLKQCPDAEFPDVIITDVHMPEMSGIEVVRHGKALYPGLRFLMLTVSDDEETLFDAIQAGASGYLLKDVPGDVLAGHIEQLMQAGSVPMSPPIARKALHLLSRTTKQHRTDERPVNTFNLTARETEVLNLLVEAKDYKVIAAELMISPHTVRKHISNIYEKLHVSSKAQAIRLVHDTRHNAGREQTDRNYRIVLVDDHQMILDSLALMLSTISEIHVVAKFSDGRKVLSFLHDHPADLLITDVSMPYIDGITLTRDVHKALPELRILVLTVSESIEQMRHARDAGAQGYVLKKAGRQELTHAIQTLMRGESYFSASLLVS